MKKLIFLIGLAALLGGRTIATAADPQTSERTLLFLDDYDVLYRSGTHRVFHPWRRYQGNPVLKGRETPWETTVGWMSIYRNPATGRYQLWYQAFNGDKAKDRTRRCVVAYAESNDGVTFEKPDLGLFDYNGDRHNSIVLVANAGAHDRYGASVVVDPRDPDPSRRYKMAYYDFTAIASQDYPGLCVAFSPDGIHWKKYPRAPLIRTYYGDYGEPVPFPDEKGRDWVIPLTMSDALDAIYDPRLQVFVIYCKMWIDGPAGGMSWKHALGRTQSKDFIHWSQPQLVLAPDDEDPPWVEFHTVPVFFYDDCYFGLMQILHRAKGNGVINIELALSRDGFNWQRPFRHQLALPRGGRGQFDGGAITTCASPVILPSEIRFYYSAYSGGATSGDDYSSVSGIGFATIPRDRFAGLRPDTESDQPTLPQPLFNIGQVTLKPVELTPTTTMTLNAVTDHALS